jgi:hypothetical protein
VLGGKKPSKLGAKKLGGGDVIDFDAAERKAKEEAERIEKLGYDPEAEDAAKKTAVKAESKVVSPSPVSPGRGTYGNPTPRERSGSDAEKLGMGMARLGFGQIGGGPKPAAAGKKMGGFGSVGPIKAKEEGMHRFFPVICNIPANPPPQMTASATRAKSSARRRASPPTSSSAKAPSTPPHSLRLSRGSKASRAPAPSLRTRISGARRTMGERRITVTLRARRRTL